MVRSFLDITIIQKKAEAKAKTAPIMKYFSWINLTKLEIMLERLFVWIPWILASPFFIKIWLKTVKKVTSVSMGIIFIILLDY